jgi:hypothetical protein
MGGRRPAWRLMARLARLGTLGVHLSGLYRALAEADETVLANDVSKPAGIAEPLELLRAGSEVWVVAHF